MDEKADDLHGAFACYDGSATYLFLTNHTATGTFSPAWHDKRSAR